MGIDWKSHWDRSETEKLADMASMVMVIAASETLLRESPSVREAGTFKSPNDPWEL